MTTGSFRDVSPSAIQRNWAPSVIDVRPCVSIKVTTENLPISLKLRQRLKNKLSTDTTRFSDGTTHVAIDRVPTTGAELHQLLVRTTTTALAPREPARTSTTRPWLVVT